MNTPAEIAKNYVGIGKGKVNTPPLKLFILGIMAGIFIGIGGIAYEMATATIGGALGKLVGACMFPAGLALVLIAGSELFTGNCLIIMDVFDKRVTWGGLFRDLFIVFFSNLIGALCVDLLIVYSGNLNYSGGLLGAYTIKVAVGKIAISPLQGITSGILCNILVCLAVLMATSARDIAGKVWAIFFPICAFVVGGFEHCVANMFYIPAGILASLNPAYVAKAEEAYGITAEQIATLTPLHSLANFIPVTLGNMLGGMVFVGLPLYLIYKKNWENK